jgi:ribonuclease D
MLETREPLTQANEIAALAAELAGHAMIALDTEFIRETTFFPTVELIQVATRSRSWLIDAAAFRKRGKQGREELRPFLDVLENPSVLKILHAAQGDQECFFTAFGVLASPSFDTAVGASLCGYGDSVGLGNLLKSVLNVQLKKGHARTNWSVRPLPAQLLEYAHSDVEHLVELTERLFAELDRSGRREWALQLTAKWEDRALYENDPEELAAKLAHGGRLDALSFSALRELMKWREARVRSLNLPRRWVADDAVLLDLARVRPKDLEHLSAFRGLNKGELKNSGESILEALRRAESAGKTAPPQRGPRQEPASQGELQVLDLLKCFVGILSDQHRIAIRHLATTHQLLDLVRQARVESPEVWVESGVLSRFAADLVGAEIFAFLQGKRGLSVETPGSGRNKLGVRIVMSEPLKEGN